MLAWSAPPGSPHNLPGHHGAGYSDQRDSQFVRLLREVRLVVTGWRSGRAGRLSQRGSPRAAGRRSLFSKGGDVPLLIPQFGKRSCQF